MYLLVEHGSFPRRVTHRTPYEAHLEGHETISVEADGPQVGWRQAEDGTFFDPNERTEDEPTEVPA